MAATRRACCASSSFFSMTPSAMAATKDSSLRALSSRTGRLDCSSSQLARFMSVSLWALDEPLQLAQALLQPGSAGPVRADPLEHVRRQELAVGAFDDGRHLLQL